ncbi:hypothetical protein GA0115254_108327 [Streptomyces sp. Ncost-T10-10d]|nr:hypothetical protein GA0115254_108327 [Streptomyces sp. Ncost-T10-10d]
MSARRWMTVAEARIQPGRRGNPCGGIVAVSKIRRQRKRLPAEHAITDRARTFTSFAIG